MMKKITDAFASALKEINSKLNNKQLIKFGALLLVFFVVYFVYSYYFIQEKSLWLMIFCIYFAVSIFFPVLLRWPYRIWMLIALVLGFFTSRLLLFLLFYFFITPIGLLYRFLKGDFLSMKIDKKQASYWLDYKKKNDVKTSLKQQF